MQGVVEGGTNRAGQCQQCGRGGAVVDGNCKGACGRKLYSACLPAAFAGICCAAGPSTMTFIYFASESPPAQLMKPSVVFEMLQK